MARSSPKQLAPAGASDGQRLRWDSAQGMWRPDGGRGVVTMTFATFTSEARATVTGQTGLPTTPAIALTVIPGASDDAYAQDWHAPTVRAVVAGTGFDVVLRPAIGAFKGTVNVAWSWT